MILVECKLDEMLVRHLLNISRKSIQHEPGKGKVCRHLQRGTRLTGIVDEDPGSAQPAYIQTLSEVEKWGNIRILKDNERNNYLVVLSPFLEGWILEVARKEGVNVKKEFNLPDNARRLHEILGANPGKFEGLLRRLAESEELEWLKERLKKLG